MHTMKLDALSHKTHIKVLRLDVCTFMILSKIAHLKCGTITHSVKETRQQNEQWGQGCRQQGRGGWTKFEEGGVGNIGGLHKMGGGGVGPLCQLCMYLSLYLPKIVTGHLQIFFLLTLNH